MTGGFRLPPGTGIGRVHLRVRDLERSLAFYRDLLGLRPVDREPGRARLSADGRPPALVVLEEDPGAVPRPARSTGLYHVAVLFPDRPGLARAFLRLARAGWPFHGFSDHGVSEAVYLSDPDGNGVELYADRPHEAWPRRGDGRLAMATRPLDVGALVASLGGGDGGEAGAAAGDGAAAPPGTCIGHIHLHVADLAAAEEFYAGALGLEVTQRDYPGALFFAAGGYHHHVGVNVWAGRGAPRPPEGAAGLLAYSLALPDAGSLAALVDHLRRIGLDPRPADGGWQVADPDGHRVLLEAPGAPGD